MFFDKIKEIIWAQTDCLKTKSSLNEVSSKDWRSQRLGGQRDVASQLQQLELGKQKRVLSGYQKQRHLNFAIYIKCKKNKEG